MDWECEQKEQDSAADVKSSTTVRILCVNAGSSSIKTSLYNAIVPSTSTADLHPHDSGVVLQHMESKNVTCLLHDVQGKIRGQEQISVMNHEDMSNVDLIVHRVVHGGHLLADPVIITPDVMLKLQDATAMDPLHNTSAIRIIQAMEGQIENMWMKINKGKCMQIATFDTFFYKSMNPLACAYALPLQLTERYHIKRYGFHGFAHQSMLNTYYQQLCVYQQPANNSDQHHHDDVSGNGRKQRLITCQLGSGCSITALHGTDVMDHSMGMTPLDGLVMATRCGSIDPGIVLYLQRIAGLSADRIEQLLYYESGLMALSNNMSSSVKSLQDASSESLHAKMALDIFVYQIIKYIGQYIAALQGCDALIFGGGVGENGVKIRERIIEHLSFYGFVLDAEANRKAIGGCNARITMEAEGKPAAYVVHVDEESLMAQQAIDVYLKHRSKVALK